MASSRRDPLLGNVQSSDLESNENDVVSSSIPLQQHKSSIRNYRLISFVFLAVAAVFVGLFIHERMHHDKDGRSHEGYRNPSAEPLKKSLHTHILEQMLPQVDPCSNFFEFACGAYERANVPDPGSNSSNLLTFTTLENNENSQFAKVLAEKFTPVGLYNGRCLDTKRIDADNSQLDVVKFWLAQINLISDEKTLWRLLGLMTGHELVDNFIAVVNATQLWANSQYNISALPDSQYLNLQLQYIYELTVNQNANPFINSNNNTGFVRGNFAQFVRQINADLKQTLTLNETQFVADAYSVASAVDSIYKKNNYSNPQLFTISDADKEFNGVISLFLQGLGDHSLAFTYANESCTQNLCKGYADHLEHIAVQNFAGYKAIYSYFNGLISKGKLSSIKNALTANLLVVLLPAMNSLYADLLYYQSSNPFSATARGDLCFSFIQNDFYNVFLHEWYVESINPGTKDAVTQLVDTIYTELGATIERNNWLDQATRTRALNKWTLITKNIIYDSSWENDQIGLMIMKESGSVHPSFLADFIAAHSYRSQRILLSLDLPLDVHNPELDQMTPEVVNAFYDPVQNSINLIPGLIQFPAFDPEQPQQLNLAQYGWVIGHELTHGFDNDGRLYDGIGREKNWWTKASIDQFNNLAQCLVEQYSSFNADGYYINGTVTLGENLADNGGIGLAWRSYIKYQRQIDQQYGHVKLMKEYSNDQLFWLYAAQLWCGSATPQTLYYQKYIRQDVHSPFMYRVNGTFSNMPEFAQTWKCGANSTMVKDPPCKVW
jgi:predicted metalloendopeptidase